MPEQITLYTFSISPFSQKVEIVLKEAKLPYETYEIDLANKPDWFAQKINPTGKVPAIAYGGPDVDPETPSPESFKLAESSVIAEFFDEISNAKLLPGDPISRARARFFSETLTPLLINGWYLPSRDGGDPAAFFTAVEALQRLLPAEGYAVGQWSIADAAVTPFLARAELGLKLDIGRYEKGKGRAVWDVLEKEAKYARFRKYLSDVKSRDSFKETFDEEAIVKNFSKLFARAT